MYLLNEIGHEKNYRNLQWKSISDGGKYRWMKFVSVYKTDVVRPMKHP